jgi:hypothetical protein
MAYWRMQLHPDDAGGALGHSVESLAAGYIGLDFAIDVGDLNGVTWDQLPEKQKPYRAFAHEMAVGDQVLVIVHHFPFALATVAGEYNYIRNRAPELGVWFRHFRKVEGVMYYGDYKTNARDWTKTTMTDTICPLRDESSISYQLIEEWLQFRAPELAVVDR